MTNVITSPYVHVLDEHGEPCPFVKVRFLNADTRSTVQTYSTDEMDEDSTGNNRNPIDMIADSSGRVGPVFVPVGKYLMRITKDINSEPIEVEALSISTPLGDSPASNAFVTRAEYRTGITSLSDRLQTLQQKLDNLGGSEPIRVKPGSFFVIPPGENGADGVPKQVFESLGVSQDSRLAPNILPNLPAIQRNVQTTNAISPGEISSSLNAKLEAARIRNFSARVGLVQVHFFVNALTINNDRISMNFRFTCTYGDMEDTVESIAVEAKSEDGRFDRSLNFTFVFEVTEDMEEDIVLEWEKTGGSNLPLYLGNQGNIYGYMTAIEFPAPADYSSVNSES